MWPFKRKEENSSRQLVKSILCIPGFWTDPIEIIDKTNGAFLAVTGGLIDIINKRNYSFDLCERDQRMKESFQVAGKVTFVSVDFLNEIDKHTSVIYIWCETGGFEEVRFLAKVGVALLNAGGIGIKVETTGKAFEREKWIELSENAEDSDLYEMFVLDTIMQKDHSTFSCGMHNIGLKDTIISNEKFEDAIRILSIFNYYQVTDKPVIKVNETFQTEMNSPFYRIKEELNQPYKNDELFGNPFGMWRLVKE